MAAAGIEIFSNIYCHGKTYVVQVYAEELSEMVGVALMVWATWELLKGIDFGNNLPPD